MGDRRAERRALAPRRRPAGDADLLDVSSGGIAPGSSPERVGPNYQLPLAESVRERNEPPLQYRRVF